MKIIKFLLDWVWQLPQNILGFLWRLCQESYVICRITNSDIDKVGAIAYLTASRGAVTLGKFIFVSQNYKDQEETIKHECGHVKQSLILGPLYLIVIGIPSIIHAWLNDYIGCCKKSPKGYYHFFTERILMGEFDIKDK